MLEIGPGLGILTQELARRARRVVAFELDRELAAVLPSMLPENVEVVQGDALVLDPAGYLDGPYKLVANLPYQITSPFLFRYLSIEPAPTVLVVMVQREVAERITATAGDLSYLAVAVQSAARPRIVRLVPPGAFHPRPKVESAVVKLEPLAEPLVPPEQRAAFLDLVRAGFGQPRKQLLNSLEQGFSQARGEAWPRAEVRALLDRAGIAVERRPQELRLEEWRTLFAAYLRDASGPCRLSAAPVLRVPAYAKVNLSLEITGRRTDGFHEIVSVTQLISLADRVEVAPADAFSVEMVPPLVDEGENLAGRAALALAEATGQSRTAHCGSRSGFPLAAGLGGGSSDAAATLRLLDRLWGTNLGSRGLAPIAATLGSDVPLFLGGGTEPDPRARRDRGGAAASPDVRPAPDLPGRRARPTRRARCTAP